MLECETEIHISHGSLKYINMQKFHLVASIIKNDSAHAKVSNSSS